MSRHRLRCCVPFCPRGLTTGTEDSEGVCSAHWRAVPIAYRKAYARALKRRPGWDDALDRLCRRCKRAAIEAGLR